MTHRTTFSVKRMDCPSEEQMIRMALGDLPAVRSLRCNIPERTVEVWHSEGHDGILARLDTLGLDSALVGTEAMDEPPPPLVASSLGRLTELLEMAEGVAVSVD